jgi:hypothetical protein
LLVLIPGVDPEKEETCMKLFGWYFKSNLLVRILLGLILGAVCGLAFGPAMAWVTPFGEIFHPPAQNDRHAGHYSSR